MIQFFKTLPRILCLFIVSLFTACGQKTKVKPTDDSISTNAAKVLIDENLPDAIFEGFNYTTTESVVTTSVNGVEVGVDSSTMPITYNARIEDSINRLFRLDTCKCQQNGDGLDIMFRAITTFYSTKHKLEVKIRNHQYEGYLIDHEPKNSYLGEPEYLKLKDYTTKKGEQLYGLMAIRFNDTLNKKNYNLHGPFTCIIE